MSAGTFYRPKPAAAPNAFEIAKSTEPTDFSSARARGRAKAHQTLTMTDKGRANIQASSDRLNTYIRAKVR